MPLKLKRKFEKEYGSKMGGRIFYALQNKRGIKYPKKELPNSLNKISLLNMRIKKENIFFPKLKKKIKIRKMKGGYL